jgi:fructokinase
MLGEDAFFEKLQAAVQKQLNGYLAPATFSDSGIRDYIVPPKLGDDAGLWGSLALAEQA